MRVVPRVWRLLVALVFLTATGHALVDDSTLQGSVESYLDGAPARLAAARGEDRAWTFDLSLYAWAAGLEGDVGLGPVTAPVDVSFSDILEDLEIAGSSRLDGRGERWGFAFDLFYLRMSSSSTVLALPVRAEVSWFIAELAARYLVLSKPVSEGARTHVHLEAVAGLRYHNIQNDIGVGGARTAGSQNFVDPLVGFHLRVEPSERWVLLLHADIGGFDVGSELSWNLILGATYRVSERFRIGAGYRWLDVDYNDDGFALDLRADGPFLSFTYRF